jgi:hypothetical protein
MQILTTATGPVYRAMAAVLGRSMREWGWPPLQILADAPVEGWDGKCLVGASTLPGGRELKTGFGKYLEDGLGPVMLVDCDCVATGPFPALPRMASGTMGGRVIGQFPAPFSKWTMLASTLLIFGDVATAQTVSAAWLHRHRTAHAGGSDEPSLFEAAMEIRKQDIGGSYAEPIPNLTHLGATSLDRNTARPELMPVMHFRIA